METNMSPGHVGGHGRSGSTVEVSEPQMSRSGGLQSWQERQLREYIEANLDTKLLAVEFSGTQSVQAVYPESATTFFYVDRDAQIRFSSDPSGQVSTATILQNGASTPMSRIDAAAAQGLQASLDAKVQGQTPSQGSEVMLRRLIAGINAGKPNLDEMNPQLAAAIGKDLPKLQVKLADLGPVESIQLLRVTQAGMDVYKVQHDRGSSEWSIELSPAGTLVGAMVP